VLPYGVLELRYYLAADGRSPFEEWFSGLDAAAGAKVSVAFARVGQGNISNAKGGGEGVLEYRIN
jgi:putative component of toxin-antitoxin plasmid stabilization module